MVENIGPVNKSTMPRRGRKSYFTPEGRVALLFLKMYTQLSAPKLLEQLNGGVHYQIFCDIYIHPERPLTNYKLIDDMVSELAGVRATAMKGSFGTQKEHCDQRRDRARKKETDILYIFFGILTANLDRTKTGDSGLAATRYTEKTES